MRAPFFLMLANEGTLGNEFFVEPEKLSRQRGRRSRQGVAELTKPVIAAGHWTELAPNLWPRLGLLPAKKDGTFERFVRDVAIRVSCYRASTVIRSTYQLSGRHNG
jgi:hypothetical protein